MKGGRVDRLWIVGGVIAAFLIVAVAWFFAISPMVAGTSSVKGQTTDAQMQTVLLQHKIGLLEAQSAKKSSLQQALVAAREQLPATDGLSAFTRQVQQQATAAQVTLTQITVGVPTVTSAGPNGTGTATVSSSAKVDPAGHLYAIPVTIGVTGSFAQTAGFIDLLQHHGTRAALLSNVQVSGSTGKSSGKTSMSLQVSLFAAPQTPAAEAALKKLAGSGS